MQHVSTVSGACPQCGGAEIVWGQHWHTLLGWFPRKGEDEPRAEDDPNHHHVHGKCVACSQEFEKHWKPRNKSEWYTSADGAALLAGTPGCCENRWVPRACSSCGEPRTNMGSSWTQVTGWQHWCDDCGYHGNKRKAAH